MGLPLIFPPDGTPPFIVEGHARAPSPVFDDVEKLVGHARRRRVFTSGPSVVQVAWYLSAAQMAAVDAWYEDVLRAGAENFTAETAKLGGPRHVEYQAAKWIDPYVPVPIAPDLWKATGSLLLTGEPSDSRPATGALAIEIELSLTGSAVVAQAPALALEVELALGVVTSLALEVELALAAVVPYIEREAASGGGYIERETGGGSLGRE